MEIKVYLAGGMNNNNWQEEVIKTCYNMGFMFFNPRKHLLKDSKEYTFWDLFHVNKSDIIFAYMQKENPSGLGLSLEIGYAKALNKHIILIDEKSKHDKQFENKFKIVRDSASVVFDNFENGLMFLKKINNGVVLSKIRRS